MNQELGYSASKPESRTYYWLCWECGTRYPAEVNSCEQCGSRIINKITLPSVILPSCGVAVTRENGSLAESNGIINSLDVLTQSEIDQGYIGIVRASWVEIWESEGGGISSQRCCWCGQTRQGNNVDHIVGPCEHCNKKLLKLSDTEFDKRKNGTP